MGCGCTSAVKAAVSEQLAARGQSLSRLWQPQDPYPAAFPWLGAAVTREFALKLLSSELSTSTAAVAPSLFGECFPNRTCTYNLAMPALAGEYYSKGGFTRMVVETLYYLAAIDGCETRCATDGRLWSCELNGVEIKQTMDLDTFQLVWIAVVTCCCNLAGPPDVPGLDEPDDDDDDLPEVQGPLG